MNPRLSLLAMAGTLALAGGTQAADTYRTGTGRMLDARSSIAELCPLDSHVVALGKGNAVLRYTYDPEGADMVRVVTAVWPGQDGDGPSMQFVTYLTPGQTAEVSATGGVDSNQNALELAYDGGVLSVRSVMAPLEN